uniref:Uncharacterized protein n=1 Tax=Oryza meridionalis TaxID=40149 RepID=A0A0E0F3S1_9ORYZ
MLGATNQPLHNSKAFSEFIRFSSLLNNNIYINPWNVETITKSTYIAMDEEQARHVKHYTFLKLHGIIIWTTSFITDLSSWPCVIKESSSRSPTMPLDRRDTLNLWNIKAMYITITMDIKEKQVRHVKHNIFPHGTQQHHLARPFTTDLSSRPSCHC